MNQTQNITVPHSKTYDITMTALMAAVTCILAPLSIPIGPVPIYGGCSIAFYGDDTPVGSRIH